MFANTKKLKTAIADAKKAVVSVPTNKKMIGN